MRKVRADGGMVVATCVEVKVDVGEQAELCAEAMAAATMTAWNTTNTTGCYKVSTDTCGTSTLSPLSR